MLVKTFNDDLSWEIQRILIKSYFKVKEQLTPKTMVEALTLALEQAKKIELLEKETAVQKQLISEYKPKVTYYEEILKSVDTVTVTQIAKDYGMSGKALNQVLSDLKVQFKQSGQWLLYEKYHGEGYTKTETASFDKTNRDKGSNVYTKWTQKGRVFLYHLLKQNNVLPLIEQK